MYSFSKIAKFLVRADYYDKACVMLDLPIEVKMEVARVANLIDVNKIDMENGGIEDKAHITVLYGVEDKVDLKKYFTKPIEIKIDNKVTYFDQKEFTVAKIEVFSDELKKLHYNIKKNEPNSHKYTYSPHITIAYLKKGKRVDDIKIKPLEWTQREIALERNGLLDIVMI